MRPRSAISNSSSYADKSKNQLNTSNRGRVTPNLQHRVRTLQNSVLQNNQTNHPNKPNHSHNKSIRDKQQQNPEAVSNKNQHKRIGQLDSQQSLQKRVKTQQQKTISTDSASLSNKNSSKSNLDTIVCQVRQHDPFVCVCSYCKCGKHLCKIHPYQKPHLQSSTTYQKQFVKKNPFDNVDFQLMGSYKQKNPIVDSKSIYNKDYPPKTSQTNSKISPVPCIQIGGPSSYLTSYANGFPGYKSRAVQSFKPGGGEIIEGAKLNTKTTYSKQYGPKNIKPSPIVKGEDNLKSGNVWINDSTYKQTFKNPGSKYSTPSKSRIPKVPQLKYVHQFNTTYNDKYTNFESSICPAKIQLQTKHKFLSSSRLDKLREQREQTQSNYRTLV